MAETKICPHLAKKHEIMKQKRTILLQCYKSIIRPRNFTPDQAIVAPLSEFAQSSRTMLDVSILIDD